MNEFNRKPPNTLYHLRRKVLWSLITIHCVERHRLPVVILQYQLLKKISVLLYKMTEDTTSKLLFFYFYSNHTKTNFQLRCAVPLEAHELLYMDSLSLELSAVLSRWPSFTYGLRLRGSHLHSPISGTSVTDFCFVVAQCFFSILGTLIIILK